MTYEEFMKLEKDDGVIVDGEVGTVTRLLNYKKGEYIKVDSEMSLKAIHDMREIEVSFSNRWTECTEKLWFVIYTDFPKTIHNRIVLDRLSVWDPFSKL